MLVMAIQISELKDRRPLNYFLDRLPGRVPKNWEIHESGFLMEPIFPHPDAYIQEAYDDRIDGITPGNHHLRNKITEKYESYKSRGLRDRTLFTLRLMGTGKMIDEVDVRDVERLNIANIWLHEHPPNANMRVLVFGFCSYFEQVAMVEGDVEGIQPTYATLISACTTTSDNMLVFARRLGQAHNKIGIIGGTLNEDEQRIDDKKYKTPDEAMGSEAMVELGIKEDQFDLQLKAVLSDRVTNKAGTFPRPVLFYDLSLNLTKRQIESSFGNNDDAHKEHSELIFIPNTVEGILEFMKDHDPSELHPPADAVLSIALERATGIRTI